jgi:hypothetical protein
MRSEGAPTEQLSGLLIPFPDGFGRHGGRRAHLLWLADEIWVALDQASAEEPASQGRSKTG